MSTERLNYIGIDKNGVRRQYTLIEDAIDKLNGYPSWKIAVRVLIDNIPTDFIVSSFSFFNSHETNEEAEEYLIACLKENNIKFRKE